jgi:hypothetical protein
MAPWKIGGYRIPPTNVGAAEDFSHAALSAAT